MNQLLTRSCNAANFTGLYGLGLEIIDRPAGECLVLPGYTHGTNNTRVDSIVIPARPTVDKKYFKRRLIEESGDRTYVKVVCSSACLAAASAFADCFV